MEKPTYGTVIEQGEIVEMREEGKEPEYKVKSLNRPGVISPWIKTTFPAVPWHAEYAGDNHWRERYVQRPASYGYEDMTEARYKDTLVFFPTYAVKDKVLFVLFDDGTGKILCRM